MLNRNKKSCVGRIFHIFFFHQTQAADTQAPPQILDKKNKDCTIHLKNNTARGQTACHLYTSRSAGRAYLRAAHTPHLVTHLPAHLTSDSISKREAEASSTCRRRINLHTIEYTWRKQNTYYTVRGWSTTNCSNSP